MVILVSDSVPFIKCSKGGRVGCCGSVGRPGGFCSYIAGELLQEGVVSYYSLFIAGFVVFPTVHVSMHVARLPAYM